jgi:hypothetical protein
MTMHPRSFRVLNLQGIAAAFPPTVCLWHFANALLFYSIAISLAFGTQQSAEHLPEGW